MSGTILSGGPGKSAVLICFLFFSFFYSQEGFDTTPLITLRGNTLICSSDPAFNRQLMAQENKDYGNSNSGKVFVFRSKDASADKKPVKMQAKTPIQNTDRPGSEKLRKTVSDFEQRKKTFDFCHITGAPFSRELPYSSGSDRSYIAPSTTSHDFSRVCIFQYKYLIKLVLELLYIGKYQYFNNRSLDFCFSEVFSVRPPPLFLV